MIENIKQFVNEHQTLIVVIIGVLVICFIYWFPCCKDRPSANKVNGGEVGKMKVIVGNRLYESIGMMMNGDYLLWVLTDIGENFITTNNYISTYNFLEQLFFEDENNNLYKVIKNPVGFLFKDYETYSSQTIKNLFNDLEIDELRNLIYSDLDDDEVPSFDSDLNCDKLIFDFGLIITHTNIPEENKQLIIENYHKLDDFLQKCHGVAKVNYIGQLASKPISFRRQPNDTENLCYSKIYDKDFNFPKVSTIFDECKEYIRNWYVSNDFYKNLLNRNYALNESRNQIYISNRGEGQFADIFPAQKVVMMLFFLCLAPYMTFDDESFQINELNPNDDNQDYIDNLIIELSNNIEYLDMIASYMIFVHLFNSFCGCRMEGKWNINISNSYVYIYTQINEGECLMNNYKMNLLEQQQILNHINELNLGLEVKKMHEFRALIYFLKEIAKDDIGLMNMFGVGEINNDESNIVICNFGLLGQFVGLRPSELKKQYKICNKTKEKYSGDIPEELNNDYNWYVFNINYSLDSLSKWAILDTISDTCSHIRNIVNSKEELFELLDRASDETLRGIIRNYVEAYEATDSEFEDNEEEEKPLNFLTTFFTSVYEKFMSLFS